MNILISLIEKTAPLIAGALGGPFASMAVSLLTSVFGGDPKNPQSIVDKITADVLSPSKLKQLEMDHQEALLNIQAQNYAAEVQDEASAREQEKTYEAKTGHVNPMLPVLSLCSIAGLVACIYALYYLGSDKAIMALITTVITTLLHQIAKVYNFYFGDSKDNT